MSKRDEDKRDAFLDHLAELLDHPEGTSQSDLNVAGLIEACPSLSLRLLSGASGLERRISQLRPRLLGLALAGFSDDLEPGSVHFLGNAERRYLSEKLAGNSCESLLPIFKSGISCFVIPDFPEDAADGAILPQFLKLANDHGVPVLASSRDRNKVVARVVQELERRLSPSITIHGNLVVFCGLGLLLVGKSGVGKSDCTLDLVTHGYQLVADDAVHLRRNPLGQIIGRSQEMVRYHMDVRGVGIVNVRELFSIYSVLDEHSVDVVIYLKEGGTKGFRFDHQSTIEVLGETKPLLHLPVSSGRNWANLIQVAVRNYLLRSREGVHAEKNLAERLERAIQEQTPI